MISKRIHKLTAELKESETPVQDSNGDYSFPQASSSTIERVCRAESNTVDGRTIVKDGINYEYSYLVFTDTGMPKLPMGSKVSITIGETDEVFGMGEVVKFERGQRVTRIWLK